MEEDNSTGIYITMDYNNQVETKNNQAYGVKRTRQQPTAGGKSQQSVYAVRKVLLVAIIILLVLILLILGALLGMMTIMLVMDLTTEETSAQRLTNILNTLTNLEHTSITTTRVIDDTLLTVEMLLIASSPVLPSSCQEIKKRHPNSPSGTYMLLSSSDDPQYVYCNMGELCGSGGGWTRLAYLDMSDSTVNCPPGFYQYEGVIRACGRADSYNGSCQSVTFPSHGISYSQVCGRVAGYQYGTTNAIDGTFAGNPDHNNLDSYYVDGVSITHGSPRQHVWTLMASAHGFHVSSVNCPCSTGSDQAVQSFIGNNYFCESGDPNNLLLWDGQGCRSIETACCNAPGLPWFHRDYGNTTTTDYLELRVCGDQSTDDEDVPVTFYEIYVQ